MWRHLYPGTGSTKHTNFIIQLLLLVATATTTTRVYYDGNDEIGNLLLSKFKWQTGSSLADTTVVVVIANYDDGKRRRRHSLCSVVAGCAAPMLVHYTKSVQSTVPRNVPTKTPSSMQMDGINKQSQPSSPQKGVTRREVGELRKIVSWNLIRMAWWCVCVCGFIAYTLTILPHFNYLLLLFERLIPSNGCAATFCSIESWVDLRNYTPLREP